MGRAMPVVRMRHSNYYKLDCSATRPLAACVTVTCRGRSSVYRSPLTRLHYRNLLCCSDPLPYTLPRDGAASAAGASAADVSDPRKATYRLRYFDIRGLGEPIRMIFRYAGVPFEDVRIRQDQWPDLQAGKGLFLQFSAELYSGFRDRDNLSRPMIPRMHVDVVKNRQKIRVFRRGPGWPSGSGIAVQRG